MPALRTYDRIEISKFPTPGNRVRLLYVLRDSSSSGYEVLPEGTLLVDCPFLAQRDVAPYLNDTYRLAKIDPDPQSSKKEDFLWYFINKHTSQEEYNFEFKFLDEASTKPLVTRTYITLRSEYVATDNGTADPVFSELKLISQLQERTNDPVMDSLFVIEKRMYVALPGVIMPGAQYGDMLAIPREFLAGIDLYTTTQKVLPNTPADKDALVVESTVVPENSEISVKKTTSFAEGSLPKTSTSYETNKEGQVVTVVKTIQEQADAPTFGEIKAIVGATTEVEVENRLGGVSYEIVKQTEEVFDNKVVSVEKPEIIPERFRAGILTTTTTRTSEGTSLTALSLDNGEIGKTARRMTEHTVQSSIVERPIDSTPTLAGVEYNKELGVSIPYTEAIVDTGMWAAGSDVVPLSASKQLARTTDFAAAKAAILALHYQFPTQERIDLPNKLISLKAVYTKAVGGGSGWTEKRDTLESQAAGSLGISGDLLVEIEQGYNGPVPATIHLFYLEASAANTNAIKTKTGASIWPAVKPRSHTIVMRGLRFTRSIGEERTSDGTNTLVASSANGSNSVDISVTQIPPTIHGAISITESYDEIGQAYSASGTNSSAPFELSGSGLTTPDSLPATNITVFPSGKYILTSNVSPYLYGLVRVTAVVVDTTGYV